MAAGTDAYFNLQGNEGWHIDNTYQPRSAKAGILRAAVLPAGGNQTAFWDGRAALRSRPWTPRRSEGSRGSPRSTRASTRRWGPVALSLQKHVHRMC